METQSDPRPTLVLNPPDDDDFRSCAEELVENGIASPAMLQECLRTRYARAVVRPRELAGEHALIWYVYRDGHWIRSGRPDPDPAADGR